MVQEAKTRPLNRLKSMYALRAEVDKMYQGGAEASEEGKPVAWVMLEGWANAILNAMGVKTVFPENYSSLCAAQGAAHTFMDRSEEEGFPTHLCGYARTCVGYTARMMDLDGDIPPEAPAGGMPKPTLLLASGETCDARFKWFQSLGRFFDAPVWTLEAPSPGLRERLPPETHERNVQYLIKELKEFVAFLENLLGTKMDYDKLEFTGGGTTEINRLRWEINELRKTHPGPMHTRDFWSVMTAALFRGAADPEVIVKGHEMMLAEVQERVDNGVAGINRPEKYRLSFEGLPPWHSLGFLDQLAERGWNFVCETAYRPQRPVNIDLSKYDDPMERYVRRRYRSLEEGLAEDYEPDEVDAIRNEIVCDGTSSRLGLKHISDYQVDGVVLHVLLTCRATSAGLQMLKQRMLDVLKVPALIIEGDIIDVNAFNAAEALRNAEAFEETMDHYRKVRRDLGMPW
jgi:benzoyl-CoA reductase/2-hydroxyglutaryl-CoA dehydratase subunit BcrC/BadD/HgdB